MSFIVKSQEKIAEYKDKHYFLKGEEMDERRSTDGWLLWLVICVTMLLWLLICQGCHTVHGIGTDLTDMTADYVK